MSSKLCADKIVFCLKQTPFIGKRPYIRSLWFTLSRHTIHCRSIRQPPQQNTCLHAQRILSFSTQIKEQKDDDTDLENESEEEEEYENEDESEYEYEYEYEYETEDEFEGEDEECSDDSSDRIQSATTSEISENFKTYSENMMNDLFVHLPKKERLQGKPIEHFISPLVVKPLQVFEDEIHNKFKLMRRDMKKLYKRARKVPIENESELRDIIDLAYDKLNVYTSYIENNFDLSHSPKHYLMRRLRVDHGNIVYMSIRKIMYFKYPAWVESDNWATEGMYGDRKESFVQSHELEIGFNYNRNTAKEPIDPENDNTEKDM